MSGEKIKNEWREQTSDGGGRNELDDTTGATGILNENVIILSPK